eukprot:6312703-Pyramimonas_sp.AAC.1
MYSGISGLRSPVDCRSATPESLRMVSGFWLISFVMQGSSGQSVTDKTRAATMPLSADERLAELRRPDDGESRLVTLTAAQ